MALQDIILQKIKDEITNDPQGLGYAGKTDAEILTLLNEDVTKITMIPYTEKFPPPINRILVGLQSAPNAISLQDVADAKVFVAPIEVTGVVDNG